MLCTKQSMSSKVVRLGEIICTKSNLLKYARLLILFIIELNYPSILFLHFIKNIFFFSQSNSESSGTAAVHLNNGFDISNAARSFDFDIIAGYGFD